MLGGQAQFETDVEEHAVFIMRKQASLGQGQASYPTADGTSPVFNSEKLTDVGSSCPFTLSLQPVVSSPRPLSESWL